MRIGIDASNIRAGGGLTHLREMIAAVDPEEHGLESMAVWGCRHTLDSLPERDFLQPRRVAELESGSVQRALWRRRHLDGLLREDVDLLFAPGGIYLGAFRPFVTMSQNLLPFDPPERARFGLSRPRVRYHLLEWLQRRTFQRAQGVIFMTETARKMTLARTGPLGADTKVVPHGLAERFRCAPRPARPLASVTWEDPLRVLYVSIVNLYKHQWHVADAVARLREEGIPVALDLIGPAYPPALARLEQTLRRVDPDGEAIRYLGRVPYDQLHDYYRKADLFAFASSCETFGIIVLEAMAAGLPTACSGRSALPDVVGDAGMYFDPEDPADIARSLKALLTDADLRDRLAAKGYARAQQFTWARCAEQTMGFIAEVWRTHQPGGQTAQ